MTRTGATYSSEFLSNLFNSTAQEVRNYTDVTYLGSSTEVALLRFAQSYLSLDYLDVEKAMATVVNVFPFDSRKKSMGVVVLENDGRYRVFIKGSPEAVLARCTKINRDPRVAPDASSTDASVVRQPPANPKRRRRVRVHVAANDPGLAYAEAGAAPRAKIRLAELSLIEIFHDLTWLRRSRDSRSASGRSSTGATGDCERGRRPGDNGDVRQQPDGRIDREGDAAFSSTTDSSSRAPSFRSMSAVERKKRNRRRAVRGGAMSHEDKKLLVETFKDRSYIVAVTGDGTNDGPSAQGCTRRLFSMGQSGTEIAKEASDIVLMNDDFAGIVEALKWGRCINDSVKKFLQFQLSVNIVAAAFTIITYFVDLGVPLDYSNATQLEQGHTPVITAVQLLWVNLIMDTLAALALATDQPDDHLLDRPAESWKAANSTISIHVPADGVRQSIFQLPCSSPHLVRSLMVGNVQHPESRSPRRCLENVPVQRVCVSSNHQLSRNSREA